MTTLCAYCDNPATTTCATCGDHGCDAHPCPVCAAQASDERHVVCNACIEATIRSGMCTQHDADYLRSDPQFRLPEGSTRLCDICVIRRGDYYDE